MWLPRSTYSMPQCQDRLEICRCTWKLHRNCIIMKAWLGRMSIQPSMLIWFSLLHVNRSKTLWENTLCCVCLLLPSMSPWSSKGATGAREYACICMYVNVHVCLYTCRCIALYKLNVMSLHTATADFSVSLELQGGNCSDQLTLICRHSDIVSDPNWIHNGTAESSQLLDTAFPGALYSVQSNTEHRVTISGVGNVQALDGYIIQCVYGIQGNPTKSNAVKYSFIPPGQCM